MSIFDAIKHPLSTVPTIEELSTLPESIYRKWVHHPSCTWYSTDTESSRDPAWVAKWMANNAATSFRYPEIISDIALLRKIILEWDT
jgi:hypothetical protein